MGTPTSGDMLQDISLVTKPTWKTCHRMPTGILYVRIDGVGDLMKPLRPWKTCLKMLTSGIMLEDLSSVTKPTWRKPLNLLTSGIMLEDLSSVTKPTWTLLKMPISGIMLEDLSSVTKLIWKNPLSLLTFSL